MLGVSLTALFLLLGGFLWWQESQSRLKGAAIELLTQGEIQSSVLDAREVGRYDRAAIYFFSGATLCAFVASLTLGLGLSKAIVLSMISGCIAFLSVGRYRQSKLRDAKKEMQYYVPITMERLVMAVESGLDVISGIQTIVELEVSETEADRLDPVTKLLRRIINLTNEGMRFEDALTLVSRQADCSAVSHALVHLAVAYKEGGELVQPLRELSDSCQSMYQESVEEEIAKMPVKATLPLVLTFAGLIVLFLATPLVQVVTFVEKASFQKGANK